MLFKVGAILIGTYVCVRVVGGTALGVALRLHTRRVLRRASATAVNPVS